MTNAQYQTRVKRLLRHIKALELETREFDADIIADGRASSFQDSALFDLAEDCRTHHEHLEMYL